MTSKLFGLFGGKQKFYAELDESKVPTPAVTEASVPVVAPIAEPTPPSVADTPKATTAAPQKKSKKAAVKSKAKAETPAPTPVVPPVITPKKVEPTEVAFASANLLAPTLLRRRPGPSLASFKAMARNVIPANRR